MADALDTLLNQTLPNFLGQEISNLRTEARFQAQEEKDQKKYLQEWNRNETRYQDKIRTEREERNEERDRIIISRGFEMDLDKKNEYYGHLVKSGRMKSVFGYDLLEGEMSRSRSELDRSSVLMQGIDIYNLNDFEHRQIENLYKSGKFEKGFDTLNEALDRKVDPKNYPEINVSVKTLSSQIDENIKVLANPLNLLDSKQKQAYRDDITRLQSEISTILAPLSRLKVPDVEEKPFSPKWNEGATAYLASTTGLSPEQFNETYGKDLTQWVGKVNREGISLERANAELEKFASKLKGLGGRAEPLRFTVPSGKYQGKELNKSIVNDLLKQKRINFARSRGGVAKGYEWLDMFAQELGFDYAEGLNSKEGVIAMRDYYSGKKSQASQIDFSKPFTLTR